MKRKAKRIVAGVPFITAVKPLEELQSSDGFGTTVPPGLTVVNIYFDQKDEGENADAFYDEQQALQWKTETGKPITNWKVCAAEWIFNHRLKMKRKFRLSPFSSQSY